MTDPRLQLSADEIARGLREMRVPQHLIDLALRERASGRVDQVVEAEVRAERLRAVVRRSTHVVQELGVTVATGRRLGDRLDLSIVRPPRTKKNGGKGGFGGIRQRKAYRDFRDAVVAAIAPLKHQLRLPLPEQAYNIAATYYVDRGGEKADKCGLDQGLYDALENAGVVTNDWQFRTDDGTRIIAGDPTPRVELTITPIEEPTHV